MAAALSRGQVVAAALAAAMAVASAVVPLRSGLGPPVLLVRSVSGAVFMAAGVVAWVQGAPARLGRLFLLAGAAMCLINLTLWPGPVLTTLRVLSGGYALFGVLLVHLLLAFPDGRISSRLARVTLAYGYVITGAYMLGQYLIGDAAGRRTCFPVGCASIGRAPIASDWASRVVPATLLACFPLALALLVAVLARRWRAAAAPARRTLRPVLLSLVATCGLAVTSGAVRLFLLDSAGWVRVGIAVVWGVTSSAVAVALLGGVLRNRLVLYGMGSLVSRLGLDGPDRELEASLARLLRDPTVQLLRARPDGAGFTDLRGGPVTGDATAADDRSWWFIGEPPAGAVVLDAATQPDPQVVQAVVGALRLVLENLTLHDRLREQLVEVAASRTRIVEASDAERRRVERDLHDGAQQHLVSMALAVQQARRQLTSDPDGAGRLLGEAEAQLGTALREIRDLARGLHPAILSEEGVGAAIESLADRLPLRVDVQDRLLRRYSSLVETTAYYVVCESLVNVVKHSGSASATVRLTEEGGTLGAEVEDHGTGGADPERGSGLRGLADRVSTVGGTLDVGPSTSGGTTVCARVPVDGAPGAAYGQGD